MAITGSIQEKNGRYHMVINMPTEDGRTKPKWESTGLKTRGNKKIAQKMLDDRLAELNKYNIPYSKITVSEYFKGWLSLIQREVRPNTYRSYEGNMLNHIIPYFEKHKVLLQELKPYHLENYYSSLLQADSKLKDGGALSPMTIKHHHQNISKALSDAVRRGLIMYNPASAAKTPRTEKFKSEYLDPKQIDEMLTLFKGNTVELPVMLCAVYGFRRSEVCGLKWCCVDFDKRTITVAETLQQNTGGDYTSKPKTESSYRTLPMTETVYTVLKAHKQLQDERRAIMGNYYVVNDYVCTWSNGEVISPNYLTKTFSSVIAKSTLPKIRLHDLRHSVATNLLHNGVQVVDVQEWLGHANASTTLDVYSHAAKSSKDEIARKIQAMITVAE
jgi:integrase